MTTTCPNCQQPVRSGAKYCGFCGSDLMAAIQFEAATLPALEDQIRKEQVVQPKAVTVVSPNRVNQTVTTAAIILMFLIIVLSIVVRHWSNIGPWFSQILAGLNIP